MRRLTPTFLLTALLLAIVYPALAHVPAPSIHPPVYDVIAISQDYETAPVFKPPGEVYTPTISEWSSGRYFTNSFGTGKVLVPAGEDVWIVCQSNPINYIDLDGRDAIFVHGTWSDPGAFTSEWKSTVLATLRDVEYEVLPDGFDWGGGNTRKDRSQGAEELFGHILDLHKAGKPINLVGHSHGGNVILETVTKHVASYNSSHADQIAINNVILFGTPIRDDYLPNNTTRNDIYSVGTFNLISNDQDIVQNEGGYNKHSGLAVYPVMWMNGGEHGDAARTHPLANNIFIDYKTMYKHGLHFWQHTYAHSMPKENIGLWNEFIAPRLDLMYPGTNVLP